MLTAGGPSPNHSHMNPGRVQRARGSKLRPGTAISFGYDSLFSDRFYACTVTCYCLFSDTRLRKYVYSTAN